MKVLQKNKIKSFFKCLFLLLVFLSLYIFMCAASYSNAVSEDISDSVFRLHVIAASDSKEDQNLKYIVRDNLLEYMNQISKDTTSKEEAMTIAVAHEENFYNIAKQTIEEQGYDYDIKINIGNFNFPTKNYGDISLPAGNYDALRVEIGPAQGQNWWCVMFPPLCFVDVSSGVVDESSKELMKENLTEEEYSIISDDSPTISFKFKIIEFLQNKELFTASK